MVVEDYRMIIAQVENCMDANQAAYIHNMAWLKERMHPYFFYCNSEDIETITTLACDLHHLQRNSRLLLCDNRKSFGIAQVGVPGALYTALESLPQQPMAYLQLHTSYGNLPLSDHPLEVIEVAFEDVGESKEKMERESISLPDDMLQAVQAEYLRQYGDYEVKNIESLLTLIFSNNAKYVRTSPPQRIARLLWLLARCRNAGGVFLEAEEGVGVGGLIESRLLFAVENPPEQGFLLQLFEVFKRLGLTVPRAYCLNIEDGEKPYFLATFYISAHGGQLVTKDSPLFRQLRAEMYATQLIPSSSLSYKTLIEGGVTNGPDAALVRAFIGFCHTNLAHTHPDSFDFEGVARAFHNHPELTLQLVHLFHVRFDPVDEERKKYDNLVQELINMVENFTTGRRFLDQFRRTIFRCCLSFITHTQKTNFFIEEKRSLAFRLDPAYLNKLAPDFVSDLPADRPFRITYFSGRSGSAYHIGFSDIARGGWRTVITQGRDDYVTAANTLFRETYVLAHTQHLKNKDIYEGGSKMVAILETEGKPATEALHRQLHLLQYSLLSSFLDIFVTRDGCAADTRIVDYYRDEEPIELGPDENMHDSMIELVAKEAVRRGYVLGAGIMSSKQVGINHKEFGVTSTGVTRFAEVCLAVIGIDMKADPFRVIFTGGPNGDVAGNCMAILLKRCPHVAIPLIIDGTGALCDPLGVEHQALQDIVLQGDVDSFDPTVLHPGGFLLYRTGTRKEGMQELFKKVTMTEAGLRESWVSNDEFYKEYNSLIFKVPADLFIPAGGRPETIDAGNFQNFFAADGKPNCRVIVEGANSFITPEARLGLQRRGVILMRDASANKCGVIASSYEILAGLLLSEEEFLANKPQYVAEVVEILEKRAGEEASVILKRHQQAGGELPYTEISNAISREINSSYARLFDYFQKHSEVCERPIYRRALLDHLPPLISHAQSPFRERVQRLPEKIKFAILASEIASSLVYHGSSEETFIEVVEGHLTRRAAMGCASS